MTDMQNFETVAVKLAGVLGALVSMRFLQGSWLERLNLAVGGTVLSYFASPWVSERLSMPEGLTGFLLGLFGMAIASKAWETLQLFPMNALWQAVIDRVRGRGA